MSVCIGAGISTHPDARVGGLEAASAARAGLQGRPADLALVFAAGAHLAAPEATLEAVDEVLAPDQLAGCGAAGVLGAGRELETGTAVSVWAASLGEGRATTFHVSAELDEDAPALDGMPPLDAAGAVILLADPFTFAAEQGLAAIQRRRPGVPVLGGLASARTHEGSTALFHGGEVVDGGAVGVVLEDVEVLPCVSQGAIPVGPELTVTAAEGNLITELAGRPALDRIRDVVEHLDRHERELVAGGLLVGLSIGGAAGAPGDFLVRGVLGADPDAGAIAVGAAVRPGQIVRLHARDADSADRDLAEALDLRTAALGGAAPAGALAFTCNGRGRELFGSPDHDAAALERAFAGAPVAGFFAAGEIGPVGGECFLHGFTATVAIFPA